MMVDRRTMPIYQFLSLIRRRGIFLLRYVLLLCVAIVLAKCFWLLTEKLLFLWLVPYYRDADVFFAMGRGILNGLVPYRDLFDIKTPAIFLLSALSLWMFEDMTLAHIANVIVLIATPVIRAAAVLYSSLGSRLRFWYA